MEHKSSVQIIVNSDGVQVVRLCGRSWNDEPAARLIYDKIQHLVGEIDRTLKFSQPEQNALIQ